MYSTIYHTRSAWTSLTLKEEEGIYGWGDQLGTRLL